MTSRNRAACLDEDPELFFPTGTTGPALDQIEQAKLVCRRCEVLETCLEWAIESRQEAGVWGALSADERRALERRTARARPHCLITAGGCLAPEPCTWPVFGRRRGARQCKAADRLLPHGASPSAIRCARSISERPARAAADSSRALAVLVSSFLHSARMSTAREIVARSSRSSAVFLASVRVLKARSALLTASLADDPKMAPRASSDPTKAWAEAP